MGGVELAHLDPSPPLRPKPASATRRRSVLCRLRLRAAGITSAAFSAPHVLQMQVIDRRVHGCWPGCAHTLRSAQSRLQHWLSALDHSMQCVIKAGYELYEP